MPAGNDSEINSEESGGSGSAAAGLAPGGQLSGSRSASAGSQATQGQDIQGPFVSDPVTPGRSGEMGRLPVAPPWQPGDPAREVNPRQRGDSAPGNASTEALEPPSTPRSFGSAGEVRTPSPSLSFNGIGFTGVIPPDPVGDVGPNHYIQMVNSSTGSNFAVYNKSGALLSGPTSLVSLWSGQGNACETAGRGDPIVLYDEAADRWMLSHFAVPISTGTPPWFLCIAISQTADPTGAYFLYAFQVSDDFPDYPKYGVWPDAYYLSTNDGFSDVGAFAFNRTNMLAGSAATFVKFKTTGNFILPSDLDGPNAPPANSPNYFYRMADGAFWGGVDRLEIFEFRPDFATPANSTFALATTLPTSGFDSTVCDFFASVCIPQQGTSQTLDSIARLPMWRLQYRNFGAHETMVGNFTVDVDNTNHAGIRWFELRKTGGGAWSIFQEGTHAPDSSHRWMGSVAMDQSGNLALGYSVSSSSLFPALRYATRLAGDPAGALQPEVTLVAGGGSQTGFSRWGDYSSLNVDPSDGCAFWYTGEYYQTTSSFTWATRIGSFTIAGCGATCAPPASGNWTVGADCALTQDATIAGNVLVQANRTLTINSGVTLTVGLDSSNLTIQGNARVIIETGGKIN